jgi:hypothetical protein
MRGKIGDILYPTCYFNFEDGEVQKLAAEFRYLILK